MDKSAVAHFWDAAACGEILYLPQRTIEGYEGQRRTRYELEPAILEFVEFERWKDRDVLEIGVGLGADHQCFAEAGARLSGIDLTAHAIELARRRFDLFGLKSRLSVGDAENLPFEDGEFDLVYSWGVIHHSPNTAKAAREILRVLRPGGTFKVMIYNRYSLVGLMLWLRYGYKCRFSLTRVYDRFLESPGTKAYTPAEAARLFESAADVRTSTVLTHGDLLESSAGQRHGGVVLTFARRLWPRWLLRRIASRFGLFLLIEGRRRS